MHTALQVHDLEAQLSEKVALLLTDDAEQDQALIVALAELGADVAIGCRRDDLAAARSIQSLVEAEGRQCLIVPIQPDDAGFLSKLTGKTLERLGRIDLFLNLLGEPDGNGREAPGDPRSARPPADNRRSPDGAPSDIATAIELLSGGASAARSPDRDRHDEFPDNKNDKDRGERV